MNNIFGNRRHNWPRNNWKTSDLTLRVTFTGNFERGKIKYRSGWALLLRGGSSNGFEKGPKVLEPAETQDAPYEFSS